MEQSMEDNVTLEQISTQLSPYFINQYERLMALIDIKPSTQSTTKYGTAERFMEIYTAATQSLPSTLHAISYTRSILQGLGWTESSLSLKELIRGDNLQLHPQIVKQLMDRNYQPMEAAIMSILSKTVDGKLHKNQSTCFCMAVCILINTRYNDPPFMELFDAVRLYLARHSLAVAFTCSVLERAGWNNTVELRRYAASDFCLEKQYPLIDLCLTVAAYFRNMTDTDYRNAKVFISTTHLNGQAVEDIDRTDFVLLLKDRNIISPGNVSKIEDRQRYPVFFKDYKDNYSKFFPPETSSSQIADPNAFKTKQTETKCSVEIKRYEEKLMELQEFSSIPITPVPHSLVKSQKDCSDASIFMSTINLAKQLVQQANSLSDALHLNALFKVAFTIPKSLLSSCEYQSELLTSDGIVVRVIHKQLREIDSIWPLNTLIEKVQMMQNSYNKQKTDGSTGMDALFITDNKDILLGVANMYLKCLYYGISAEHKVPIIGPAGKDIGTLRIKVALKQMTRPSSSIVVNELELGTHINVEISVIEASHLPSAYTYNLYFLYKFWRQECEIMVESLTGAKPAHHSNEVHQFQHLQVFKVEVTKDFLEYIQKEVLAIEVWGHKKDEEDYTTCSLSQRWRNVTQNIQLWVDIKEVNLCGDYVPVTAQDREDVKCGRIFQLRQGQSRYIDVSVIQGLKSENEPLICDSISSVSIGSMFKIRKNDSSAPIDSYQEKDLERLQTKLSKERKHLALFTKKLLKQGEVDAVIDKHLFHQWITQLSFYQPDGGPGIPNAPTNLQPGMETRVPIVFLDLSNVDGDKKAVTRSIYSGELNEENADDMVELSVKTRAAQNNELKATAHWDPGVYKADCLRSVTADGVRIYAIVQVGVKLQNPPDVEILLKKRICMKVIKLKGGQTGQPGQVPEDIRCGVTFQLVTDIPSMIEQPSLNPPHCLLIDLEESEKAIDKIYASIHTIEETLELNRLKQEYDLKKKLHELHQCIPADSIHKRHSLPVNYTFVSDDVKGKYSEKTTHLQDSKTDTSQTTTAGITKPIEATDKPLGTGQAGAAGVSMPTEATDKPLCTGQAGAAGIATPTEVATDKSEVLKLKKGEKVMVETRNGFKTGVIKFIGRTEFAIGEWIGLELTRPEGKNNGSVDGVTYFKCKERYGIFVQKGRIVQKQ